MSTAVMDKMDNTICPHCSKKYVDIYTKRRHIKTVHKIETESEHNSLILCPLCADDNKKGMTNNTVLIQHLRDRHNVLVEEEELTFPNCKDFKIWKKLEHRHVDYVTARTRKDEYKKGILYHCNRSNFQGFKSNSTKKLEKKGGSIKINGMCPSRITADFYFDGQVKVHYVKTHVGHDQELRTRRLAPEEQDVIGEKLTAGVSQNRIIEDARILQNGKLERANLLQMADLRYLKKKYNVNKSRDPIDSVATYKKVVELNSNNRNYAFIYKEIGRTHPILETTDFALGYMNNTMERMLKNYSDIICMDGTHKTNMKNYDLTVMMIKDNENDGFPVAFFLSNRQDHVVQEIFLQALKDRIGEEIVPKYFMSDGDGKYYEAWKKVMGNVPRRLLCAWHVGRNWKIRGRPKIKNAAIKEAMGKDLINNIMKASSERSFIERRDAYFQMLEEANETEFLSYLQKMYFKDKEMEMRWAYCYRLNAGINTNMALESFNSFLKIGLLERNTNVRIERLLDVFDMAIDKKMWKKVIQIERPTANTYQDRSISAAHKAAQKANLNDVKMVEFGKFQVKSSGAEMENEESEYLCIEEVSEERLKLKEAKNEFLNEKYQDLNNKENQEENIDDGTIREMEYQDFWNRMENFKTLDIEAFFKAFDKIKTLVNPLLPKSNISTKRKLEKQNYYPQTQKKQRRQ